MSHKNPVFDPDKCPVPFVQAVPQRDIIEDCIVPPAPDPIFDCADAAIDIPPPVVPPGGAGVCPQFQTSVATPGGGISFVATVTQLEDNPCTYNFAYEIELTGGGDCPIVVLAPTLVTCLPATTPCTVEAFVDSKTLVDGVTCQFQFQFKFGMQTGNQGPTGPTGTQGPTGPQGGKFAIVRVLGEDPEEDDDEYVGLFCMEMPEALFQDVMDLKVQAYQSEATMDRRFVKSCETGSFRVISVVTSSPAMVGAKIVGDKVVLKTPEYQQCDDATVVVAGIRKGFAYQRFPAFTREQKERNDNFWGKATK